MTDPTFDPRLAVKLQAYAQGGVQRIDALEVTRVAISTEVPRRVGRPWLTLLAAAILIGGGTLAVLALGAGRHPEPARSGSIAFARYDDPAPAIWRVDVATGASAEIASESLSDSISPDGGHAAWLDKDSTAIHLVDLRSDVSATVQAGGTVAIRDGFTFSWSPSGRWVSWAACTTDVACRLVVSASDGSKRTMLAPSFPRSQIDHQAWLFWAHDDTLRVKFADGRGFLAADADGTNVHALTGFLDSDQPDGGWSSLGDIDLTVRRADGTVRWTVTFDGKHVTGMSWSPDQSRALVGLQGVPGTTMSLALVDQDGHRLPVDLPAGGRIDRASWSPDSSRVFVVTSYEVSSRIPQGAIIGRNGRYISGVDDATIAAWSPDSRFLAVGGLATNTISVLDADGSDRQGLVGPGPGPIDELAWIP